MYLLPVLGRVTLVGRRYGCRCKLQLIPYVMSMNGFLGAGTSSNPVWQVANVSLLVHTVGLHQERFLF